jgi:uncharacterized protein YkwD
MKHIYARFLVLAAIVFAAANFCSSQISAQKSKSVPAKTSFTSRESANDFDADAQQILELVNAERRKNRLTELEWDDDLARMARSYSKQMARENFFEHIDGDGRDVADRAKSAKIKGWSKIGENLFFCEGTTRFDSFAVRGWMKSPTHRQNILDRNWTTTGIGIAEINGEIYITQVFIER